jgi:hypothetical protein
LKEKQRDDDDTWSGGGGLLGLGLVGHVSELKRIMVEAKDLAGMEVQVPAEELGPTLTNTAPQGERGTPAGPCSQAARPPQVGGKEGTGV